MDRPINIDKEPIPIKHSSLKRTDDSIYRSVCPECKEGVLLVGRDLETFKLSEVDRCISCAQQFIYTDIQELRNFEAGRMK